MYLEDYLNLNVREKRILITSDVSRANSMMRSFEKRTGKIVQNITCISLKGLAEQLNRFYESQNTYIPQRKILNNEEATMLLRSVMLKNIKSLRYFNEERMLTVETCTEIYNKLNLIRGCGWNGKEDRNNKRVKDLKFLTREFESALLHSKMFDFKALLSYLLDKIRNTTRKNDVEQCFSAKISYLEEDTEKFTVTEKDFVEEVSKQSGTIDPSVVIFKNKPDKEILDGLASKITFFKGYGSFNEASYIANDILRNNIPLGDVSVLYTTSSQIDALNSAFGGNGLNASYTSKKSLKDNMYIALARRILAWANDRFSEKTLANIFDSPALRNEYVDAITGNAYNAVGGTKYFNHVFNARKRRNDGFTLGWGYRRNFEFVNHEMGIVTDIRDKKALEIHNDLLSVFGNSGILFDDANSVEPIIIYEKLTDFIYKYKNNSEQFEEGKGALENLKSLIGFENRKLSLAESIGFIDELLKKLETSDEPELNSIEVSCLSDWKHIERKNVYIVGLSLKEMQGKQSESPVLFDDEMENWLNACYKPTIKNALRLRDENIYRTLMEFKGEKASLGYSFYDTNCFCDKSPSAFYRDVLSICGKKLDNVQEFLYGNPTSACVGNPTILPSKPDYPVILKTSSSLIEKLLECPKKYYYSEIEKIPENEYVELEEGRWLDPLHRGSLFHHIAQKYVDAIFIKPSNQAYQSTIDDALLCSIIDAEANNMLNVFPSPSKDQMDYEVEDLKKTCRKFFQKMHDCMQDEDRGWRVLATEKRFDNELYNVSDFLGNVYLFSFNGEIDRIDYKVNDVENKIYFRIVDYKTNKFENKEKAIGFGKVIQHAIYRKAVMNCLQKDLLSKASKLEGNANVANYETIFTDFSYYFPKEEAKWRHLIADNEIESINITRLKAELTAIKELKEYPDYIQLYNVIFDYKSKYSHLDTKLDDLFKALTNKKNEWQKEDAENCKYCKYRDICPSARGGKL